ncbi:MAG TPA: T9SS type A sorting domain-containing protein [Catalimonadaceae bacterium]|nr:T9SS type A sorting domain-containing protein [Catalimonadaceae bacterium]
MTGTSGVFSASPAGLVFVNANTGEIDLSASAPGTYSITNLVTPVGACTAVSVSRSITITAAPLAGFSYVSNDLCQSANALNASPIFEAGAAAGTFSTSSGLSLNTTNGIIYVSASTPGNYAVVNTRAATGGCSSLSDTTFIDINPYIFAGAVTSSASDDIICLNDKVDLYSSATTYATVLLREKFNGTFSNWTAINSSAGGTVANAAWTLRSDQYSYNGNTFRSNDNSQFYMTNSQAQGSSGTTTTYLKSPVMNTIGFSTLSLDFFTFYDDLDAGDNAKVQVSTNNTTWTDLVAYTTDQGSVTGFANRVVSLNAYIGLPTVYIRFAYNGANDRYWAIDNVSVTGNSTNYNFSWASSPSGYASALQNPAGLSPSVNTFYTVSATNMYGCSNPDSPVPVTVNPLPADNAGADQMICGSAGVSIGSSTTSGRTYSWSPSTTLDDGTIAQPSASPLSTTSYVLTETITATGCSDTNSVKVTVMPLPIIISSTSDGRCGTGSVVISASSSTGTLKWFANSVGGVALGSTSMFTTPSISSTTTYYAEATSATCNALSRTPVVATVYGPPVILSQVTAAASYSQNATATDLSVTASAGSGVILGYQWYSNATASNSGGTAVSGANSSSMVPSTATVGTRYYYCVVTNSNGCTATSAVSGAIQTLLSPQITTITGSVPSVAGQVNATGYRGQRLTITGSNFANNATVSINGVAATVSFVNSGQLTVTVNNSGANSTGNIVVTNPGNGAFVNQAFQYIGYISSGTNLDFANSSAWSGGTLPTAGSDVTLAHNNVVSTSVATNLNKVTVVSGGVLTFSGVNSSLTTKDLVNNGTVTWTSTGTLNMSGTLILDQSSVFTAGNGTVAFNKTGDQQLFTGKSLVTFNNVNLAGSGNKTLPANGDMISKNLIINAGTTFNLAGSDSEIKLRGDLTINGVVTQGTSDFHFIGTTDQSISVVGNGTAVFSSINVSKPSGTLNLSDNVQIQDSLILTSGNINTQTSILEIGYDTDHRGILKYISGYVSGKVKRWFAAATNSGSETGLFPMGQAIGGVWKKRFLSLEYTEAPTDGGSITVEFISLSMLFGTTGTQSTIPDINTGGAAFEVGKFSDDGYWKVDNKPGLLIDGEYTIKMTAEEFAALAGMIEKLTLVKRVNGGDWFCPGTHLPPTGDLTTTTLGRSGVSGFSNYGFAGEMDAPLAIELADMQVNCTGISPTFSWSTVKESDSRSFIIQQSSDGRNWSDLGKVSAAGNSSVLKKYSFSLDQLDEQSTMVRLVLVNTAGPDQMFNNVNIPCGRSLIKADIELYPNPNQGTFVIDLKQTREETLEISVLNMLGQNVYGKLHNAGRHSKIPMDLRGLPSGMYQIIITGNSGENEIQNIKVLVK